MDHREAVNDIYRPAYVVEQPAYDEKHDRTGVARVYVSDEARAQSLVGEAAPGVKRTYREIAVADMPEAARENLLRARLETA